MCGVGKSGCIRSPGNARAVRLAHIGAWERVWESEQAGIAEEVGGRRRRLAAESHGGGDATAAYGASMGG